VLPIYGWRELSFIVGETEADVLISPNKSSARQTEDYGQLRSLCPDLQFLALPQLDSSLGARFRPDRSVDSDSWVFYTSGTTASPKGARHSDSTIRACATGIIERYEITSSDRVAIVWPVSHIGGIAWVYAGLEARCRLLFVERFGREAVWALRDGGVTLAGAGLPFLIEYLAAQKTLPEGTRLFPEVRAFTSGGMTKPPSIHYEIKEACGSVGVLGSYGMTEAPILTAARPGMMDWEIASTEGPPMDGVDLRVVREDGSSAEIGEEGEIRVRAPQLMLGYVDPSLEIGAFDADGYFITGDLGSVDGAGNLAITGRKKDVIIRKGENISAKELEDALIDIPGVDDVAVIGVPDAATGERVCAVVVASGKAPDLIEVGRHLADRGFMRQK
jgi:acyl-CoA synthetase (AMP-forming)/AMP-acid ligase II